MIFNSNISKRESDVNLSDATATSGDIISGKTAYGASGKIVGTLVPGTDTSDATATSSDILYGKTAYIASGKATGSMINRGAVTSSLYAGGSYTIPAGYHNGSGKVTANSLSSQTSGTATASDILSGKTAWVNGTQIIGDYVKEDMGDLDTPLYKATITIKNNSSSMVVVSYPYYSSTSSVSDEVVNVNKSSSTVIETFPGIMIISVGGSYTLSNVSTSNYNCALVSMTTNSKFAKISIQNNWSSSNRSATLTIT